jgi:hypothetical protein
MAALAATLSCALLLGGAGTAAAQTETQGDLGQPVEVTGTKPNGKTFNGTYNVKRFVTQGETVYAVGTLKGRVKNRPVRRTGVQIPVESFGDAATTAQAQAVCRILTLRLGPLDLNLLGLRVQLNRINLRVTAIPGPGNLLGNLLCAIAGLLDPPTLAGGNLSGVLNSLLALSRTG